MAYSSDHDSNRRTVPGGPDPFASLAASPARRRFWLFELLISPFQDQDERASYRSHQKGRGKVQRTAAQAAAQNGRGADARTNEVNGHSGNPRAYAAAPGYAAAYSGNGHVNGNGRGNDNGSLSPAGRQPYDR